MDVIDPRHPGADEWVGHPAGKGCVTKELIHALHDAEQLILQTCAHPEIEPLGLSTPLQQAVRKIRQCADKVSHIDATLADVDVHALIHGGGQRSQDDRKASGLADFITTQFTRQRGLTESTDATTPHLRRSLTPSTSSTDVPGAELVTDSEGLNSVMLSGWDDWGLDFFSLSELSNSHVLESYGGFVLAPLCHGAFHCGTDATRTFVDRVASLYNPNRYHNAIHAAQVCHLAGWMARSLGVASLQTGIERAAFSIAALCHDLKHFGRNNMFCINTEHALAVTYNNVSVLENMHAATCWELLQNTGGVSMLATLSRADRAALRAQIIEYILATDMSEHFEVLSKFRVKLGDDTFSMANAPNRCFVSRMCIKAGDVGHSALPWALHVGWSLRVTQEFYEQGDDERSRGLPISALCDRSTFGDIGNTQKGFLEFVCMPLFEALAEQETRREPEEPAQEPIERDRLQRHCISEIKSNAKCWTEDIATIDRVKAELQG